MIVVVMGVSGAGKTTVGRLLAETLGWEFHDADELHSEANRMKMHRGIALTDEDRAPWLARIRDLIRSLIEAGKNAVIACSALKRSYREEIVIDPEVVKIVYLKGSPELIAKRLGNREGHFMNPALLQSQLDDLEEPENAIVVSIEKSPQEIVREIRERLGL
jgi:gluconokinase